jgi:hypothetical protein
MPLDSDFTDEELREALRTDSELPTPSAEHVAQLRSTLLAQATPSVKPNTTPSATPCATACVNIEANTDAVTDAAVVLRPSASGGHQRRLRWLIQLVSTAAVVAMVLLASRGLVGTASANLKSALDATRRSVWIHATTTVNQEGETMQFESWCSPQQRITAFRSPALLHFVDYQAGIQTSYSEQTDSIMRWRADARAEEFGRAFLNALLTDGDLQASFPFHQVSAVSKQTLEAQGQTQLRYAFRTELKSQPSVHWETTVKVDSDSQRIHSWEEIHSGGTHIVTRFDYPDAGPSDIYALGARREATVVDRVASSDVVEMAREFQHQVYSFEDYEALVVDQAMDSTGVTTGSVLLRQVRRAGERFSVHLLTANDGDLSLPETVDLAWWNSQRHRFTATPLAECDGEQCTLYAVDDDSLDVAMDMQPRVEQATEFPVVRVKNASGTATIPIWPSIWPEYACRPMLITTDPSLRFDIDPTGSDGPANSLRLRLLTEGSPFAKERASYWLSLDHNRCLLKSIVVQPDFANLALFPNQKTIVSQYGAFRRSPSGIAFATERLLSELGSPTSLKRTFVVDFEE